MNHILKNLVVFNDVCWPLKITNKDTTNKKPIRFKYNYFYQFEVCYNSNKIHLMPHFYQQISQMSTTKLNPSTKATTKKMSNHFASSPMLSISDASCVSLRQMARRHTILRIARKMRCCCCKNKKTPKLTQFSHGRVCRSLFAIQEFIVFAVCVCPNLQVSIMKSL